MEYIFHETQEGLLCAQHCLNSLLQGDYYSAPDLANIAMELDAMEQTIQNPSSSHESSNYDDTGYFSIQVRLVFVSILGHIIQFLKVLKLIYFKIYSVWIYDFPFRFYWSPKMVSHQ